MMDTIDTANYRKKSLVITGLGTFLGTLDSSIVNVSLPSISRDLSTTIDMVGWVILSYSITIISLLVVFGAISSKKGFQFSYRYGFATFMFGSLLCGLSLEIYMLIAARAIQGIGAALMMSVGPALVTKSFPENERGKALSVIAMVVSGGLLLGPAIGGLLIGLGGWRWIFFVNVPFSLAGIYFTHKFISDFPIEDRNKKIPAPGVVSLALGLIIMMISLMLFSRDHVTVPILIGLLTLSALMFLLFFFFESRPGTRLIGLDIFRNRIFTFSVITMLLVFVSLAAVTVLMPFYLEQIKHLDPEKVGLYLMIIPACILVVAPLSGYLSDRIQTRNITTIGILIMIGGLYMTEKLHPESGTFEIIRILIMMGIGMGLFSTPNTSSVMGAVKAKQLGSASGINATIRTLGLAFGVGVAIAVFELFRQNGLDSGLGDVEAFMFGYHKVYNYIIYFIIASVIFSWLRGRDKDKGIPINA